MLTYISVDRGVEADYLQYDVYANGELQRKLARPQSLDEGDLFASFILAMCHWSNWDNGAGRTHVKGFLAIMEVLSERVAGEINLYGLSCFWSLARDLLSLKDDGNFSLAIQCRHILKGSFDHVKAYTEALYNVHWTKTLDPLMIVLQVIAVRREREELRKRFKTRMKTDNRGHAPAFRDPLSGQNSSSVAKLKELDKTEEYVNVHKYVAVHELLLWSLIELESEGDSMSNQGMDAILSIWPEMLHMVETSILSHCNMLLRAILGAPTFADGISSSEAMLEMYAVNFLLERFGGAIFIGIGDQVRFRDATIYGFETCLEFWMSLVSKAGRMFYESTNFLEVSCS
jgi:hypothetical protein